MTMLSIDQALQLAIQHHQAGRLDEAENIYRQILARQPGHAAAMHLLGIRISQAGRIDEAVDLITRAIANWPNDYAYYNNLARIQLRAGRVAEAVKLYQKSIQVNPSSAETHFDLGHVYQGLNDLTQARACYERAIALQPDLAVAHNNLGTLFKGEGNLEAAANCYRRAIQFDPMLVEAYSNLGTVYESLGKFSEAIELHHRAITLNPQHAGSFFNLGVSLAHVDRIPEACAAYQRAIELQPDYFDPHNNLGNLLQSLGRTDEAFASLQTAMRLRPDYAAAYGNLAAVLGAQGLIDEALAHHRRTVELNPIRAQIHSNYLYTLLFHPGFDAPAIQKENQVYNERHGVPVRHLIRPHTNASDPAKRLRIGYVSPNFREHVVGRNMIPLFAHRNREQFETFLYSDVAIPDARTGQIRGLCEQWRDTIRQPDDVLAGQIRRDGIDILVDLSLHMAENRLPLFARKPAPIQVTFAGYPGSTGLETIDYRLTDLHLDPPGLNDSLYSEKSIRLRSFWCFDPLDNLVPVSPLPADTPENAGRITFGCLSNFSKVNREVLELWARILSSVDRSRLLLMCTKGSHRERVRQFYQQRGIAPDRVDFVEFRPRTEYLRNYHRIDIGLDPLPYNGHSTSLDSLWMGVPIVTLVGRTIAGRAGFSQLTHLNLPELITHTPEQFIQVAADLAHDLPRLRTLRASLRQRMEESPLMDAAGFTREIENAYRTMWTTWCAAQRSSFSTRSSKL